MNKKYRDLNREEKKAYHKAYYESHKDRLKKMSNDNYHANRDREIARRKEYHVKHREKMNAHAKKYYHEHKEQNKESRKEYNRNHKREIRSYKLLLSYGITLEQYEEMYRKQRGKCATCKTHKDSLVVDHDHKTGKVRSLLCNKCNLALGYVKDDTNILSNMIAYLKHYAKEQIK